MTALGSVGGGAADQYQADPGGSGQYAINGIAGRNWQFSPSGGATGTATLRITLNQSYTLSRIYTEYEPNWEPNQYELRLSTDATNWTTVRPLSSFTGFTSNVTFTPTPGRYIEYRFLGERAANNVVSLRKLAAFADASNPPISKVGDANGGYNLAMTGTITNTTPTRWSAFANAPQTASSAIFTGTQWLNDGLMNSYSIPAQPSEANPASLANPARFVVDLGSVQRLNQVFLGFIFGQSWAGGGSIEVSTDNATWQMIRNQTTSLGTTYTRFSADAQYVRISSFGGNGDSPKSRSIICLSP